MRRHPFHAICPYFAMFPESFAADALLSFSKPEDFVLDPFVGRGTTIFQAALLGRKGLGIDINPVAVCISGAKVDPPELTTLLSRIKSLERDFDGCDSSSFEALPDFFTHCFHRETLMQLLYLRTNLIWMTDSADRFIMALVLGLLHGESSRSPRYFSNQMPRTISTKPNYSIRWWNERGLLPPKRDVFPILLEDAKWRYSCGTASTCSSVRHGDARRANELFSGLKRQVGLVITSPPYLDVTDYAEDQWLRLWMLGGPASPCRGTYGDDRYRDINRYWSFLEEVWSGCLPMMKADSRFVIRIGGRLSGEELQCGLIDSFERAGFTVVEAKLTSTTDVVRREASRLRRSKIRNVEHDFVIRVA